MRKTRIAQIKADIHEALHLLDLMFHVKSGRAPHGNKMETYNTTLIDSFSG